MRSLRISCFGSWGSPAKSGTTWRRMYQHQFRHQEWFRDAEPIRVTIKKKPHRSHDIDVTATSATRPWPSLTRRPHSTDRLLPRRRSRARTAESASRQPGVSGQEPLEAVPSAGRFKREVQCTVGGNTGHPWSRPVGEFPLRAEMVGDPAGGHPLPPAIDRPASSSACEAPWPGRKPIPRSVDCPGSTSRVRHRIRGAKRRRSRNWSPRAAAMPDAGSSPVPILRVLFVASSVQEPAKILDVAEARCTVLHRHHLLPGLRVARQEVDQATSGATVRVQRRSVVLFGRRNPVQQVLWQPRERARVMTSPLVEQRYQLARDYRVIEVVQGGLRNPHCDSVHGAGIAGAGRLTPCPT